MDQKVKGLQKKISQWSLEEDVCRAANLFGPLYYENNLKEWVYYQEKNISRLSRIIDEYGWPGISLLGVEAAEMTANLVMNCVSQPRFMRRCLPLVEQACRFGDAYGEWFVKIYDTIMVFEGKPQVFGTQLTWSKHGVLVPFKIIDEANVDRRRSIFTLESLERYLEKANKKAKEQNLIQPSCAERYLTYLGLWATDRGWSRLSNQ
ncbi:MAG: hypothetical protein IT289_11465 [Oligoflexia bacterium]|nr:hypothetical protein [Oligoflexia bacterium]